MKFAIEKKVPVPETRGRHEIYPFSAMQPGDSFFVPFGDGDKKKIVEGVSRAAYAWGKRNDARFTRRLTADGVRIWRIDGLETPSLAAAE